MRHGPHQGAQTSTRTGMVLRAIWRSKISASTSSGCAAKTLALHFPHLASMAGRDGGKRLIVPHLLQTTRFSRDPLIKIFRACAGQATWPSHAAFFFLDRYEGNHREYSCNKPARRCRHRIPKSASTLFAYIFGIAHRMSQRTGQLLAPLLRWRSGAGVLGRCKASKPRPAPLL